MYALQPGEHDRARALFRALDDQLSAQCILEGTVSGTIYVDHPTHAQAAFTGTHHRFFLVGSEQNEAFNQAVRRLFLGTVYPRALEVGLEMLELKYAPGSWSEAVPRILEGKPLILAQRQYYLFKQLRHEGRIQLPDGFRLRLIDASLLAQRQLKNLDALEAELRSERPSVQDFLDRSFGFVALYGDEIAGWCTSEYNLGHRCEVGIGTLRPYRRRGLATAMASALIEHALSRGVTHIGWHCFASNAASAATALTVGFEKACDYPTYLWAPEE